MVHRTRFTFAALYVVVALCFIGCSGSTSEKTAPGKTAATAGPPSTDAAGHDHATKGPHGGGLVELGKEEYHLELVHDDAAKTVTIYLLDSTARASVPIDATDVMINLTHDGKGEQFKVAASADRGDPQGKSSRFVSTDAELAEDLDREGTAAQIAVTINGKPYRGAIEREHGHEGESGKAHAH